MKRDDFPPVAGQVPFDNSTNGFTSDNVQEAIEEISISASPGFTFGRSGAVVASTWLQNDTVPSNKAGRTIFINSPTITRVFSASEDLDTYTIDVYEHEGNEVNLTLLTTLTVTASRKGDSGAISVSATSGRQLALRLATGSAKNVVAGLILGGTV